MQVASPLEEQSSEGDGVGPGAGCGDGVGDGIGEGIGEGVGGGTGGDGGGGGGDGGAGGEGGGAGEEPPLQVAKGLDATAVASIPHSLSPRRIRKYPCSPQYGFQEFWTFQYLTPSSTPQPTKVTAWPPATYPATL